MTSRAPQRVAVLAVGAALLLAGCGGGERGGSGSATEAVPAPVEGQKRGGTLTVLANEGFQNLDPGSSYFQLDYQVVYAVHRPLYSFRPDDSAKPVPDLAAGPPAVSPDGRRVTVRIRRGIGYSPGTVNRAVRSADVKYAIERAFSPVVANGYVGSYFAAIAGAEKAEGGPIAGISTPDDRTIVFALSEPFGSTFVQALSLPVTAPVPREYAERFDRRAPSRYDSEPTVQAFTGPYAISAYRAGRSLTMTRNPRWEPRSDYRPAHLDRIQWRLGAEPNVLGRQILAGRGLVNGDTPTAPIVRRGVQRHRDQISFTPLGNRYIALNTRLAPFDDVNVRRAVVAAMDRRQLQLTRGGARAGDVATHFLAPNAPGFEAAGGMRGPGYDFLARPRGSLGKAREYLRRAGHRDGRYRGPPIVMVGDNTDPAAKTAQVALAALQRLGFEVRFRGVSPETMQARFCGVPRAKVHVCPNVGWLPDFPDGYAWLYATFNSRSISPENNVNWSQLADRRVDAAMARAQATTQPGARARAWGEVDRLITGLAPAVPWFWDRQPNIRSRDVQGVIARWNAAWDLSFTSLR